MNEHCDGSREHLAAYLDGELSAADRAHLEAHLESCPDCRAALAALRAGDARIRGAATTPSAGEERRFESWLREFGERHDLEAARKLRDAEMAADRAAGRTAEERTLAAEDVAARPLEPGLVRAGRAPGHASPGSQAGLGSLIARLFRSGPTWRWVGIGIPAAAAATLVIVLLAREPGMHEKALLPTRDYEAEVPQELQPARAEPQAPSAARSEASPEASPELKMETAPPSLPTPTTPPAASLPNEEGVAPDQVARRGAPPAGVDHDASAPVAVEATPPATVGIAPTAGAGETAPPAGRALEAVNITNDTQPAVPACDESVAPEAVSLSMNAEEEPMAKTATKGEAEGKTILGALREAYQDARGRERSDALDAVMRRGSAATGEVTALKAAESAASPEAPAGGLRDTRFLFYLHGQIVEDQGPNAVSPKYGHYQYAAILAALSAGGYTVISEVRPQGTDVLTYARRLVVQVDSLKVAGVPSRHITIVGASKGGSSPPSRRTCCKTATSTT
jgi:anti-sigma factor RsiW